MHSVSQGFSATSTACGRGRKAFTLLEMLVVVTIIAIVVGLTVGVTGSLNGSRGSTAAHQLAAVLDNARARALTGEGEVVVAFATSALTDPQLAYRAVVICLAQPTPPQSAPKYEPVSGWYHLPQGYVFTLTNPASNDAGVNVFSAPDALLQVTVPGPGDGLQARLPCIAFRELGAVSLPADTNGRPVLIAIAEGEILGGQPQSMAGSAHLPEMCRWLAVQKNSGNCMILP